MASFLDSPSRPLAERRHTVDHSSKTLPTPPLSRSSSVTSNSSHKSEPGWMASYNGVDRSRNSSVISTSSTIDSQSAHKPSGLKGLFGKSKGDKPKKEKKDIDKIILTSKHAAAVKTKLALDPKLKAKDVKTAGIVGTQNSQHLSAAAQEMRHPHSGPPALHAIVDHMDLPVLTRIASGDEQDEEEEMDRARTAWIASKIPDAGMSKVVEGDAAEEDIAEGEMIDTSVIERDGTRLVGAKLPHVHLPHRHAVPPGLGWHRDEKGNWRR